MIERFKVLDLGTMGCGARQVLTLIVTCAVGLIAKSATGAGEVGVVAMPGKSSNKRRISSKRRYIRQSIMM